MTNKKTDEICNRSIITSHCYLGDTIDYFKRMFIESFDSKLPKAILKKAAYVKEGSKYSDHFKVFFNIENLECHIMTPGQPEPSLTKNKGYLFIDPPTGLSFDKDTGFCFGKTGESPNHIDYKKVQKVLEKNDFTTFSIYQHFSRKKGVSRDDFEDHLVKFLKKLEIKKEYGHAFVLRFKDFFIITISKSSKTSNVFDFHKTLKIESTSTRLKERYLELKRKDNKWVLLSLN